MVDIEVNNISIYIYIAEVVMQRLYASLEGDEDTNNNNTGSVRACGATVDVPPRMEPMLATCIATGGEFAWHSESVEEQRNPIQAIGVKNTVQQATVVGTHRKRQRDNSTAVDNGNESNTQTSAVVVSIFFLLFQMLLLMINFYYDLLLIAFCVW